VGDLINKEKKMFFYNESDGNDEVGIGGGPTGPSVVSDSLVLHLDAGNLASYSGTGTTWADLSGNGNDGTLNGVGFNSDNGGSLDFTGAGDFVLVNNSPSLQKSGDTSFQFTHYPQTLASTRRSIAEKSFDEFVITWEPGGALNLYSYNGVTALGANEYAPQANQWFDVTIVRDLTNATIRYYINGVLAKADPSPDAWGVTIPSSANVTNNNIKIGDGYLTDYYGRISRFMMYGKALSDAEVLQNFEAVKDRYGL
jgi:hypothetical protein